MSVRAKQAYTNTHTQSTQNVKARSMKNENIPTGQKKKQDRFIVVYKYELSMSLLMDFDIDVNFPNDSPVRDELA